MSTTTDDLEAGLRELFERQAESVSVAASEWDDPPMASVVALPKPRRSHSVVATIVATAAAIALVVGVAAIGSGNGVRVAGQAGSPTPVRFSTKQVTMSAESMRIDAGARVFTAGGSTVEVNSDPGSARYQTLELEWRENGVPMRLYFYFAADARDWWASSIATYDGRSNPSWISYEGPLLRTPLGTAFNGNVNLATSGNAGHLRLANLRLQPFLPPAVCKNATSKYAFNIGYDHANIPDDRTFGFGFGKATLLDTTTCAPVADSKSFVYSVTLTRPGIVGINVAGNRQVDARNDFDPSQSIDVEAKSAGSTTLHVTARQRSMGKVVAVADIPITVG